MSCKQSLGRGGVVQDGKVSTLFILRLHKSDIAVVTNVS